MNIQERRGAQRRARAREGVCVDETRVLQECEIEAYSQIWPVTLHTRSDEDADFEQQDDYDPDIPYGLE